MRQGDFSDLLALQNPIRIRDPYTGQNFDDNIIPAALHNSGSLAWQQRFYPDPNYGPVNSTSGNFRGSFTQFREVPQLVTRLDYQVTTNNSLYFRFMAQSTPGNVIQGALPPDRIGYQYPNNIGKHFVLSDTWSISPKLINEFKAGYARRRSDGYNTLLDGQELVDMLGIQGLPRTPGYSNIPDLRITGFAQPTASHEPVCGGNLSRRRQRDLDQGPAHASRPAQNFCPSATRAGAFRISAVTTSPTLFQVSPTPIFCSGSPNRPSAPPSATRSTSGTTRSTATCRMISNSRPTSR